MPVFKPGTCCGSLRDLACDRRSRPAFRECQSAEGGRGACKVTGSSPDRTPARSLGTSSANLHSATTTPHVAQARSTARTNGRRKAPSARRAQAATRADAPPSAPSRRPATTPRPAQNARPATLTINRLTDTTALRSLRARPRCRTIETPVDSIATKGDWEKGFLEQADQRTPCKPRTS